jgi:hypothetical protein
MQSAITAGTPACGRIRTAIGFVIFEMITDRQGLAQNHLLVRTAGLEPAQSSDP